MPFTIRENVPLRDFTTFRIGGPAAFFCEVTTEDELGEAMSFARETCDGRFFILGGGSNVLVNDRGFSGLVIRMHILGIHFSDADAAGRVLCTVGAGESWDTFVATCVGRGLYGVENLSWIPGTVGAAPVQNIGAYGVEVGSIIGIIRAYDTETDTFVSLAPEQCNFSYRDSLFKKIKNSKGQARYVITQVVFNLSANGSINNSYKDVRDYFTKKGVAFPTVADMREAVISIRTQKLPDISKVGTAGSFFKNPIISAEAYAALRAKYPDLPGFPEKDGRVKVPLAWIIDKICGYRGISKGGVGTFQNQALVIVNNGSASFAEVATFAAEIVLKVKEKTGIVVEPEVQYVD